MPQDTFPSPETSPAFLAALVEYTDDGVVSTDLSGKVRTWNKGAERIFGYSTQEMIGRSLSVLVVATSGAAPVISQTRQESAPSAACGILTTGGPVKLRSPTQSPLAES